MFSKIKNKLIFLLIILIISVLIGLNKTSTQLIGVNFVVTEYEIPLYLKFYNFYGRHINYGSLVTKIIKNSENDRNKVIDLSKWVRNNIQKIPKGLDIIDSHPLTIVERRVGTKDQFADLLSVLIVYADLDSFFMSTNDSNFKSSFVFFNLNKIWSLIDPYYGIIFLNEHGNFASINELKTGDWSFFTLDMNIIDSNNFGSLFNNKFTSVEKVKAYYMSQFHKLPTQEIIESTNKFDLGGRSYIQNPIGRLKFMLRSLKTI